MKIRLEGTAEEIKDILKWTINNSNVVKFKKPYEENEVKWLKHTGTMKSRLIVMYLEVEADEYDPMDAMEEAHNNRPCFMDELEGANEMEKCALCKWENSETDETLDEFFKNKIKDFYLCDYHENELNAFCEEVKGWK